MPLTNTGRKVLANMRKQYGDRAEEVFYSSINAKKAGSEKWHGKRKEKHSSYSSEAVKGALGK